MARNMRHHAILGWGAVRRVIVALSGLIALFGVGESAIAYPLIIYGDQEAVLSASRLVGAAILESVEISNLSINNQCAVSIQYGGLKNCPRRAANEASC